MSNNNEIKDDRVEFALREETLCKEIQEIRFDIGLSVYFWLHQEGIGWDYLQCNPSYGGDVWEEIAYVSEHHPDRVPDYMTELLIQAVQDLCLQVTPSRKSLETIWKELFLLKQGKTGMRYSSILLCQRYWNRISNRLRRRVGYSASSLTP